jgi:hypothetical protein
LNLQWNAIADRKLPPQARTNDLTPGDVSAAGWITMLNHNVEINHIHSGAICNEIGERLNIAFIRPESNELPLVMQKQLHRLRALDDDCSSLQ